MVFAQYTKQDQAAPRPRTMQRRLPNSLQRHKGPCSTLLPPSYVGLGKEIFRVEPEKHKLEGSNKQRKQQEQRPLDTRHNKCQMAFYGLY